jgi:myo-inositol-1(or 4)-monophosphatase
MEIERTTTTFFGVEINFPDLAKRIRLDEVALVMDVEPVVNRVILEVRHVPGNVDSRHGASLAASENDSPCPGSVVPVQEEFIQTLFEAADAARTALDDIADWGPIQESPGQYRLDLAADAAVLRVLEPMGCSILSEESGLTHRDPSLLAIVDPIDGSTNAHRGLPKWSTSICLFDGAEPWLSVVVDHSTGHRYHAVCGGGAWRDGERLKASGQSRLSEAIICLSGLPERRIPFAQYRAFGCASLELCAVAEGTLDGFLLGPGISLWTWDYLGGLLICQESGAAAIDLGGDDLWEREASERRPVVASSTDLLEQLVEVATPRP